MDQVDVQQALLEHAERQTNALEAIRADTKNISLILTIFFVLALIGLILAMIASAG